MPKYRFLCSSCQFEKTQYVPATLKQLECSECNSIMERLIPQLSGPTEVKELIDPLLNKSRDKNHDDLIKQRREWHYWEVEVPRLVEKYSLETCLEQKWLVYNDKGELIINRPPSRR